MEKSSFIRHRGISNAHTSHCYKCGRPKREGCRFPGCNDVQHCARDMIKDINLHDIKGGD